MTRCPENAILISKADFRGLMQIQIPVHGSSSLKREWIPEWARDLETTAFKQAMQEHINSTMDHYKGKISNGNSSGLRSKRSISFQWNTCD